MLPPPSEKIHIGIVGSRRRASLNDRRIVFNILNQALVAFPEKILVVVSGGCKVGADAFAKEWALAQDPGRVQYLEHPIPTDPPAKHKGEFTQRAYARNLLISKDSDILFALVASDRTGGTENTIVHTEGLGKTYFLVDEDSRTYLRGVGWYDRNATKTDKA